MPTNRFAPPGACVALLWTALAGCGSPPEPPVAPVPAPRPVATPEPPPPQPVRAGDLVTYRGDKPLGTESYKDDGDTIVSLVSFGGQKATITIVRSKHHIRIGGPAGASDADIGAGTLALENGHWQAYAIAAEQFAAATERVPVNVLLAAEGVTLPATIAVTRTQAGGKKVDLDLKGLAVTVELDPLGNVIHAVVPGQGLEVRRASDPAPVAQVRPAPAFVTRELVEVMSGPVAIRGEIWIPKDARGKVPVVLLIAGSGPTDRDGNNAMGLRTDAYRMVAEALASHGIATLRYDKRGVGQSGIEFDPTQTVLDDFVGDAGLLAAKLRADPRFSTLTLAGHSEGGTIAIRLAQRAAPSSLVLLAAPGRPLGAVLREQLATKLDPARMADVDRILGAIRSGTSPEPIAADLALLFNPRVIAMIKSEIDVDSAALLKKLHVKTAIIQGEHDAQISVVDARALARARPDAKLTLLPRMNHVFKDEAAIALPQESYADPSRPLAPGLVEAIVAAVKAP